MQYETPGGDIVEDVITVLRRFSKHVRSNTSQEAKVFGHATRDKLNSFIQKQQPVILVLPAFPWKNRNLDKVIGSHPDLGEELGLARLNDLCEELRKVYMHGALLHLIADGPVYNDLVGIPDAEYFEYGLQLRALAARKGFRWIRFRRLPDLLHGGNSDELTAESYLAAVPAWRSEMESAFLSPDFDVDREIRDNEDTRITYTGYVKLAKEDLRWASDIDQRLLSDPLLYGAEAEKVAKGMVRRLVVCTATHLSIDAPALILTRQAYENLIREKYGFAIRLSIHPSSGKTKISVPLLPHLGDSRGTPWHSSIVVLASGEVRAGHSRDFRNAYELVERDGKPYFFREKSDLFNWEADVSFDYEYDALSIASKSPEPVQLGEGDQEKLAELILRFKKVRTTGFTASDDDIELLR